VFLDAKIRLWYCCTGCTDLKDDQSRAEWVRFERFSAWCTVCGCSVFTCNNKASHLGINEECEDDWRPLLKLHRYTLWLFHLFIHKCDRLFENGRLETLLLARLMGRYCFGICRRLSSVAVCTAAGGRAGRPRGRSGGWHSTAGQYYYVPLGRHRVLILCLYILFPILSVWITVVSK